MPAGIRFIIFGQARSGSTLLVDLLNTHPDIHCDGEILHDPWKGWQRRHIMPHLRRHPVPFFILKAALCRHPAYGLKLFFDHCSDPGRVLPDLVRRGWLILYVQRRDLFAQVISYVMARSTHYWHRKSGQQHPSTTISIPAGKVLNNLTIFAAQEEQARNILARIPHLEITYEDDLQDSASWGQTSGRLLDYLHLPHAPLRSPRVTTWDRPYAELIANYEQIVAAVRSSPHAWVLDGQWGAESQA
jgi:hypothetical protein